MTDSIDSCIAYAYVYNIKSWHVVEVCQFLSYFLIEKVFHMYIMGSISS